MNPTWNNAKQRTKRSKRQCLSIDSTTRKSTSSSTTQQRHEQILLYHGCEDCGGLLQGMSTSRTAARQTQTHAKAKKGKGHYRNTDYTGGKKGYNTYNKKREVPITTIVRQKQGRKSIP
eukprot:919542-Amphidinium_carterae.1